MTSTKEHAPSTDTGGQPAWSRIGDLDLHLLGEGRHDRLFEILGAHPQRHGGEDGTYFAVWAPNAAAVSVIGDFNGWQGGQAPLQLRGDSGVWEGFVPGVGHGAVYKYQIRSRFHDYVVEKADPFGFRHEEPPRTASVVWHSRHEWRDDDWVRSRAERQSLAAPMSIYEVHLGSFQRGGDEGELFLDYRELAHRVGQHVQSLGFTHVELLPVMEHPFYGSWGYQLTGYFAPTSRFGTPDDLMFFIDHLHRRGIGVIVDWVPAHFPSDEHGLGYFDGTHLFEHADPRKGFHPEWNSLIFNYGRNEVRSFLMSNARFWLERYHADGLRVDGVASMLYLDYGRADGAWIPNEYGGRENLEAVSTLQQVNEAAAREHPGTLTIAEESTAWPQVTGPVSEGGLGFSMKWDMGWMHDTLHYMQRDPIHRRWHHDELTFRAVYAFSERFVLPLSHDEVVYGKRSLLEKMPGDDWQKFANLRLLLTYMWATPGKKLLFMGGELAQRREWAHDHSLDWHLMAYDSHRGVRKLVGELNRVYRAEPALHERDLEPSGFEWMTNDPENAVMAFLRWSKEWREVVLAVFNFTPALRENYRIGAPFPGVWRELVNSDATRFWGSGLGNLGELETTPLPAHERLHSLCLTLPPLAGVLLKWERDPQFPRRPLL